MPWTNQGNLVLNPNAFASLNTVVAGCTQVAYEVLGQGGYTPLFFGYLSVWSANGLPGGTAIGLLLSSTPIWAHAGIIRPWQGTAFGLQRIGFKRAGFSTGQITVRILTFVP